VGANYVRMFEQLRLNSWILFIYTFKKSFINEQSLLGVLLRPWKSCSNV